MKSEHTEMDTSCHRKSHHNAVEGSVGKLDDVDKVKVHLESGKVDVAFNPEKVALEKIKETIDDQGYDVE